MKWETILIIVALFLLCVGIGAQCNGIPEPPPSPISPVAILPVEPQVVTGLFELDVHWDDPTVLKGYAEVHCLDLPQAHLQVEWKVINNVTGLMVASGSEPVPFDPPNAPGTGMAAGPVPIQADLPPGDYTLWHRLRWVLVDAECVDSEGQPIHEIVPGIFVPAEGETTRQDAEGYWETVERSIPPEPVYLPLITKGLPE